MAKVVTKQAVLTLATVDYSEQVKKVSFKANGEEVDVTNMSSAGWKEFLQGLKGYEISVDFIMDADLSGLDAAVYAVFIHATVNTMAFTLKRDSGAISTDNPEIQGTLLITEPLFGELGVGEALTKSVTWKGTGAPTRDVTP